MALGIETPNYTEKTNGQVKADHRIYRRRQEGALNDHIRWFYDLSPRSLADWQKARKDAKPNKYYSTLWPNKSALIGFYEEIMKDAHLQATINNRLYGTLGEKFSIVNADGTEDTEMTNLLDRQWFQEWLRLTINSQFWGFSIIELGEYNEDMGEIEEVYEVQRRNVVPEWSVIREQPWHVNSGIPYDRAPFIDTVIAVDTKDLGLLEHCGPLILSKRFAISAWTTHAEIFAMPFLIAKTDVSDLQAVDTLEKELVEAGNERHAIIDIEEELQLLDQAKSDPHSIYNELISRVNSEIAKLIVGQTMTTDEGASYSQASVHKTTFEQVIEQDQVWTENWTNKELIPRLIKMGYPFKAKQKFKFNRSRQRPLTERVQLLQALLPHYSINPIEIEKLVNIEVNEKEDLIEDKKEDKKETSNSEKMETMKNDDMKTNI